MVKPGRDLDVEVAKKILKLQVWFDHNKQEWLCYHPSQKDRVVVLPHYSMDSAQAYTIVHALQQHGFQCHVGSDMERDENGEPGFRSTFFKKTDKKVKAVYGKNLAHAICLAALQLLSRKGKPDEKPIYGEVIKFPKK